MKSASHEYRKLSARSGVQFVPIKEINKLIYNYLWGSRDRIKRNTLIGPVKSGGIGIVDKETKFKALKASWIPRLYNGNSNTCKFLGNILHKRSLSMNYLLKCNETKNVSLTFLPQFYKDVIMCFNECKKMIPLQKCLHVLFSNNQYG